jgi:hypothetical protein
MPSFMTLLRKELDDPWQMALWSARCCTTYLLFCQRTSRTTSISRTRRRPLCRGQLTLCHCSTGISRTCASQTAASRSSPITSTLIAKVGSRDTSTWRTTPVVEAAYETHIREVLDNVFESWTVEQTQIFNKGVEKALSGVQWVVYPCSNRS